MEELNIPNPMRNDLIVDNPTYGKKDLIKEMRLLPKAKQDEYATDNLEPLFQSVLVHKAGPTCPIKAGDFVMLSPAAVIDGIPLAEGRAVLIGERSVIATW